MYSWTSAGNAGPVPSPRNDMPCSAECGAQDGDRLGTDAVQGEQVLGAMRRQLLEPGDADLLEGAGRRGADPGQRCGVLDHGDLQHASDSDVDAAARRDGTPAERMRQSPDASAAGQ